jgi:hypothetical protein
MSEPSPKPEVLYLPAIFRLIRSGELRVPAFQRGFVWKRNQVLELLESVYKYYPIGSLLFWNVDSRTMRTSDDPLVPFPHPPVDGVVDFVLDGMQRVSSLYGAFNTRDMPPHEDAFSVVFDLREERFLHHRDRSETSIDLSRLFTPRLLLEEQARLGAMSEGDLLVERSLELQRRFQEYLIPVVRIGSRDSSEVVRIFERINNTGTTLSAVDFMRALTWSDEFDLTKVLDDLSGSLEGSGFEIPLDTIAKCLALEMGVAPISDQMVKLREKEPSHLHAAAEATRRALQRATQFFNEGIGIQSYDYIPYEGQFLVFASAASALPAGPTPSWLIKWYWSVGFSEALQGRPDHYIARLAMHTKEHPSQGLSERLRVTLDGLKLRPMRKGAALPVTFVASLASRPLYSALTGQLIPPETVLAAYEPSMIASVWERAALHGVIAPTTRTDKTVANAVILGPDERGRRLDPSALRAAILTLADTAGGMDKLRSQCVDEQCVGALHAGNAEEFIHARAEAIFGRAGELAGTPGGHPVESDSARDVMEI